MPVCVDWALRPGSMGECPGAGKGDPAAAHCFAPELLAQRGQAGRQAGRQADRGRAGFSWKPGASRRCLCTDVVAKGWTEAAEEHRPTNRMSLLTGPARASGCVGQAVEVAVSHATP